MRPCPEFPCDNEDIASSSRAAPWLRVVQHAEPEPAPGVATDTAAARPAERAPLVAQASPGCAPRGAVGGRARAVSLARVVTRMRSSPTPAPLLGEHDGDGPTGRSKSARARGVRGGALPRDELVVWLERAVGVGVADAKRGVQEDR